MHTKKLHLPPIYPILDATTLHQRNISAITAAEALLEAGAKILQFRHKDPWTRDTYAQATQLATLCHRAGTTLVINDRADYTALLRLTHESTALHLGQDDLTPTDARKILGRNASIGLSTHNAAQMEAAQNEPINYVAFGPIFTTASKVRPDPITGPALLAHIRTLTQLPLVAIGGITRDNAVTCWNSGADSVAVIADMLPLSCSKQAIRDRMTEWQLLTRR
ncbi:MAG: thiamine-phosphate pyrophosphorylase [Bryobacterales bacterium]|nr:thiamine-phosphate pyrophosphorylase [Bryobacterales bacterium]